MTRELIMEAKSVSSNSAAAINSGLYYIKPPLLILTLLYVDNSINQF